MNNVVTRKPILFNFLILSPILILVIAWVLGFVGKWTTINAAQSPDQSVTIELREWYTLAPIHGWSKYYLTSNPKTSFYCMTPEKSWRDMPDEITKPQAKHLLCRYNDFDQEERKPKSIRWISQTSFVVEGGEGDGSVFGLLPKEP